VSTDKLSAQKVTNPVPSMFWSLAQARMTAASFTQYTKTFSIPLAFSSALFATCVSYASMASGA